MLKILSLFSGIGAFEKALDNLEVDYDLVGYCEIDKYASKSYAAIHGVSEEMNLWDVTKIDTSKLPKGIDLITYGFPCQDISLAGKQRGFHHEDGSLTRSGLFFEALRIIEDTKPKIAIAENVKNLTGKKFSEQFKIVLDSLEAAGYNNYWKVLNAKDYGIPQNRERVFIVSIRKDIDHALFEFPKPFPLEKRLKDLLQDEVDEKYYLSDKMVSYLFDVTEKNKAKGNGNVYKASDVEGIAKTITTREGSRVKDNFIECFDLYNKKQIDSDCIGTLTTGSSRNGSGTFLIRQVGQMYPNSGNPQAGRIYDADGISPTMDTCSGGNRMPKVLVREATKQGYAEAFEGDSINLEQPNSTTRRGRVGKQVAQTLTTSPQQAVVEPFIVASRGRNPENPSDRTAGSPTVQRLEPNSRGICNTLTTVLKDNYVAEPVDPMPDGLRIRKLTPKECFRLMGFDDVDFEKAEAVNSNTQLYKQAGNSIVVDVLEELFCMMLDEDGNFFV